MVRVTRKLRSPDSKQAGETYSILHRAVIRGTMFKTVSRNTVSGQELHYRKSGDHIQSADGSSAGQ